MHKEGVQEIIPGGAGSTELLDELRDRLAGDIGTSAEFKPFTGSDRIPDQMPLQPALPASEIVSSSVSEVEVKKSLLDRLPTPSMPSSKTLKRVGMGAVGVAVLVGALWFSKGNEEDSGIIVTDLSSIDIDTNSSGGNITLPSLPPEVEGTIPVIPEMAPRVEPTTPPMVYELRPREDDDSTMRIPLPVPTTPYVVPVPHPTPPPREFDPNAPPSPPSPEPFDYDGTTPPESTPTPWPTPTYPPTMEDPSYLEDPYDKETNIDEETPFDMPLSPPSEDPVSPPYETNPGGPFGSGEGYSGSGKGGNPNGSNTGGRAPNV